MNIAPWFLGLFAGGTIFLGLPVARLGHLSSRAKGFLNALATGILIFLLVEICGYAVEFVEETVEQAAVSGASWNVAYRYGFLFILGFSLGLLGLVWFEQRFLGSAKDEVTAPARKAKRLALMISVGLGLHNLSEGLAIGQGHTAGALELAWLLAIGFALHNATEGFGIAAPLSGHRVRWRFLGLCGLIAGGPTFFGAIVGSWWVSKPTEIFCLAVAAGTILYIIGELLHLGRLLKGESIVEIGLLVGFCLAMATDFTLSAGRELTAGHGPQHGGYFGDADDLYHYEVVSDPEGKILLYVNDHLNRPLDTRTLQGRWTLNPDEPNPIFGAFTPSEDGSTFIAGLPSSAIRAGPIHLKVAVLRGTHWAEMEFYLSQTLE